MRKALPLLAVIAIFVLLAAVNSPHTSSRALAPTAIPAPKAFDACVMAQLFIKDRLKSPSTADFAACNDPETYVAPLAGNIWKVSSYVDAQNSFGAELRNDYTVEMVYSPSTDNWQLVDVVMQGR